MAFIGRQSNPAPPEPPNGPAAVLRALGDADPSIRRGAARAAAQFSQCGEALCAHLANEPDIAVRANALTTLIKIQREAVAACLTEYLQSEDVSLRNDVIAALQQMPRATATQLPALLRNDDPDIRIFALTILGGMHDDHACEWILGVIAHDPHMNVCATALDALAEIGTPDMIPALEQLTARFNNDFVRFAVDVAIRRIRA